MTATCEWDPIKNEPATLEEFHAMATFEVGANGEWLLCSSCAALPRFKKFRKRRYIESNPI